MEDLSLLRRVIMFGWLVDLSSGNLADLVSRVRLVVKIGSFTRATALSLFEVVFDSHSLLARSELRLNLCCLQSRAIKVFLGRFLSLRNGLSIALNVLVLRFEHCYLISQLLNLKLVLLVEIIRIAKHFLY